MLVFSVTVTMLSLYVRWKFQKVPGGSQRFQKVSLSLKVQERIIRGLEKVYGRFRVGSGKVQGRFREGSGKVQGRSRGGSGKIPEGSLSMPEDS